jgi:hypothetical protein
MRRARFSFHAVAGFNLHFHTPAKAEIMGLSNGEPGNGHAWDAEPIATNGGHRNDARITQQTFGN